MYYTSPKHDDGDEDEYHLNELLGIRPAAQIGQQPQQMAQLNEDVFELVIEPRDFSNLTTQTMKL